MRDNIKALILLRGEHSVHQGMLWVLEQAKTLDMKSLPSDLQELATQDAGEEPELTELFQLLTQKQAWVELIHYFEGKQI